MAPIQAPLCTHQGCNNPTWYGLCHHHQQHRPEAQKFTGTGPQAPVTAFLHYSSVTDLWSDMVSAFPDAGDVVHPDTIHQEVLDTLSAAVDSEAYRGFPSLDVEDYEAREEAVAAMRQKLVYDLMPEVSTVTASEARELSYSSEDQFGRSAEDSKYLASFALNSEWECKRIMGLGIQDATSFPNFVEQSQEEMRDTIDAAFRRNLGEFSEIIRQVSGRDPLNPAPIAPHLATSPIITPNDPEEPDVVQGAVITDEVAQQISDFFERNRDRSDEPEVQQPPNTDKRVPIIQVDGDDSLKSAFARLSDSLKYRIEDPDGVYAARRLAARQREEEIAKARRKAEKEELALELDKELLKQRKRRNRNARGWF